MGASYVFFLLMPALFGGFGNYFAPVFQGSPEVVYPRVNNIFSGIIFNGEKIVGSKSLLPSPSSTLSLYHLDLTFVGILLTFSPMHFLGFNVMPRRIPDFPDSFHSWNFLSSIGSGITLFSFAILEK